MLKLYTVAVSIRNHFQPPSGGCVLKQNLRLSSSWAYGQPPSGGCVLKLYMALRYIWHSPSRLRAAVC